MENEDGVVAPKKKSNPVLAAVLVLVIVGALAFLYFFGMRESYEQIALDLEGGIPAADVVKRMGEPKEKKPYREDQEVWFYERTFPRYEALYLVFEDDGTLMYASDEEPE